MNGLVDAHHAGPAHQRPEAADGIPVPRLPNALGVEGRECPVLTTREERVRRGPRGGVVREGLPLPPRVVAVGVDVEVAVRVAGHGSASDDVPLALISQLPAIPSESMVPRDWRRWRHKRQVPTVTLAS